MTPFVYIDMIEFYDKFENAILENIQEDKTSKRYYKIHSVLEAYRKAGQGNTITINLFLNRK